MSKNLTKRASADQPVRRYRARGGFDDQVHLVDATPVDLVDPSLLRTYCGAVVFEVYTDNRDVTCGSCAQQPLAEPVTPTSGNGQVS